jgi:hypothetical protein
MFVPFLLIKGRAIRGGFSSDVGLNAGRDIREFRIQLFLLRLLLFLIRVSSAFNPWLICLFRISFIRVFRAPSSGDRGVVEPCFIFLSPIFLCSVTFTRLISLIAIEAVRPLRLGAFA